MPLTVDPVIDPSEFANEPQPSIEVDARLTLRPFRRGDAPAVQRAFSDPDIQFWHGFRVDDLPQAEAWIERNRHNWRSAVAADWAIVEEGDVAGRCALHLDARRGNAEIAYWLLPEGRGRGLATRAVIALTEWAHRDLGLHRILLQHSVHNDASHAVARRSGYVEEGVARAQGLLADGRHDVRQHAHLATDHSRSTDLP